jgi:predicted acylesterase/phospholipase RssA
LKPSPRIAISLGASFLGYATHAGFLARLHSLGVRPVSVGGSSAGALAAGLYAAGLDAKTIRETVLSWRLRRSFVNRTPVFSHYFKATFNSVHVSAADPRGAVKLLDTIVGGRRIEDLRSPTYLAAVTDLEGGRAHFLREGSLAKAMVASCCMPTFLSPLKDGDIEYFDGGIAHETPVDPWFEQPDVDVIIIHRISHPTAKPIKFFPLNIFNTPGRVLSCAGEQLLEYRKRLAAFHGKKLIISHTFHERPRMFSGSRMPSYYAIGEEQAQKLYDETLQSLLGHH